MNVTHKGGSTSDKFEDELTHNHWPGEGFMTNYFVRDYQRLTYNLLSDESCRDTAMAKAVGGGDSDATGAAERQVLLALGLKDGDFVVDVGCGSGRLASTLTQGFSVRYLGIDVVPDLIDYAWRRCNRSDWRFVTVTGLTIPEWDNTADFVVFFSVLTHLSEKDGVAYLREAKRVAKPGGKIIVSYLDHRSLSLAALVRLRCSQMLYVMLGRFRGIKTVLSSQRRMLAVGQRLGLDVTFLNAVGPGQSVAVFSVR
jgi:SAM-dependent methyltransferase